MKEKKEEVWRSPMKKHPYQQKCQKGKVTTEKRREKFDDTAISDRLGTVSWSNN